MSTINTWGPILGLILAIFLIIKKYNPTYSLVFGALIGGLLGGANLVDTIKFMINGGQSMMSPVLRIMASGILAGVLIKSGSADKIAETFIEKIGESRALISIAVSTMVICMVGVFIDISVITVAPIALSMAKKLNLNKSAILIAMTGGGKAGNIISPNPNTIVGANEFHIDLIQLIYANIIPAIITLIITIIIASYLSKKGKEEYKDIEKVEYKKLPYFLVAVSGPLIVIIALSIRLFTKIIIDPMIALPLGGIVITILSGNIKNFSSFSSFGLSKVSNVSLLLIGTGTIAGIIKVSNLQTDVVNLLNNSGLAPFLLAPISGIIMAGATASTTAGVTIASSTFASTIISMGVSPIPAAAMLHAGAIVFDSLPQGSFFHATGNSINMNIKNRLKLVPYEALIGLSTTICAILMYLLFNI